MTRWRSALAATFLALAACSAAPAPSAPPADGPLSWEATVIAVTDGDTVRITTADGAEAPLRIVGIDSPETKHPRRPVECGGVESTEFARRTLEGRIVTVVVDASQGRTDRYDRLLGYVELDPAEGGAPPPGAGQDYSTLAAAAGMARSYVYDRDRPPVRIDAIRAAEEQAKAKGMGLWSCPATPTTTPTTTRKRSPR